MIDSIKETIYRTLRRGQKYTQTDNVYIAKQGGYLMASNVIIALSAFLLSVAFARFLPKEIYGQYRFLLSAFNLLTIFTLQSMNRAVTQSIANGHDGVLSDALKTKLRWGLLGGLAGLGIALYYWFFGNAIYAISFLIMAAFLPIMKGAETYQAFLAGKKLFNKKAKFTALAHLFSTSLLILTVFFSNNIILIIAVYFASFSFWRTIFLFISVKKFQANQQPDPKMIRYGKHLSFMNIPGIIADELDKILLYKFLGPIQLAIYAFALAPIQHLRSPLQTIQELALPKLATKDKEEIRHELPKKLLKSLLAIAVIVVCYLIIAPYFFSIFYPEYMESVFYSKIFAITLFVFPASMMALSLQARIKTKELYKISFITPIVQIGLIAVMIPLWGILGAILARLILQIFYSLLVYYFFRKI